MWTVLSGSMLIGRMFQPRFYSTAVRYCQKLSYFNDRGQRLRGDTVGNVLDKAAVSFGSREAIVDCQNNVRKTFVQLKRDVDEFAAGLLALGLKPGDRIGILSPNNYEWVVTQLAAAKSALVLVTLDPAYGARDLEYCFSKVGMRAVVSMDVYKTYNFYDLLCSAIPTLSISRPGEISDNKYENLTHVVMIAKKELAEEWQGTYFFQDVPKAAETVYFQELDELQNAIQFDDPVIVQFTSGTTGRAKGVTLSHHHVVNNCSEMGRRLGYHEKCARICVNSPMHHWLGCIGATLSSLLFGACVVLPDATFEATACAQAIQKEKCSSIYGSPEMFVDLLNLKNFSTYDFSSLNTGLIAGPIAKRDAMKTIVDKLNVPHLSVCFGSTEAGPAICQSLSMDSLESRISTVGPILGNTEIKVVDVKTSKVVPCGTPGELWTRGPFVMLGYWNDRKSTEENVTPDRWFKTGDLASVNEEGYVRVMGRIKEVIRRAGEKVYPREIEEFLNTHPKISNAYVVGVPDERVGQEVCAWISLKENEKMTTEDLVAYCKGKMVHYKIPRYVKFTDKFPTTVTGKVRKFEIAAESAKEFGLH